MPNSAHQFDAAADGKTMLPGHDLRSGEIDRIEARGTETIDLNARHMVAIVRSERRSAGDVAARLADGIDTAEHYIIDEMRVEIAALLDGPQHRRGEPEGRDLVQRSVRLAASARRANMIVNESFGHLVLPVLVHVTAQ